MGNYVVGYDGSACAKAALKAAADLAESTGAGLVVVFGYEPPSMRAGGPVGYQKDAIEAIGEERLAEAAAALAGTSVPVETLAVPALPVEGLLETAAARGASLIVIGTRGETPLMGAVLGSTAYKLLHRSPLPVLVVPAPE
jgi:nucleotide-binding universal stress UspA family protein